MTLTVAPAVDAFELATLHAEAFADEAWSSALFSDLLAQPAVFALVAALEGEPVGLALGRAAGGEAEVLTVGVAPVARRAGAGRALLGALAREAAARDAVRLLLEVSERNAAALALYASAGFAPVGRRPAYYADGSDAQVLARSL